MLTVNTDSAINSSSFESAQTTESSSSGLGQTDFITLMLAQMENQDPSEPLDPNQFMSQLAQFSTVNGIQDLQKSFDALAAKLSSDQTLQAANLVGRDVMVPGDSAELTTEGSLAGQAIIPAAASNVTVKVYDNQGALVRSLPLGSQSAGEVNFQWDGFSDDGSVVSPGSYRFVAEALIGSSTQALETGVQSRVESVILNQDGSGTSLNLVGGQAVPLSAVQQIM